MAKFWHKKLSEKASWWTTIIIIGVFVGILVVDSFLLTREILSFVRSQAGVANESYRALLRRNHYPPQPIPVAARIDNIRAWMTFDYINRTFGVPPEYLKNQLLITDKRYPDLSIYNLARKLKKNPADLLNKVKEALKSHVQASPSGR